jgi:hypothetical protein
MSEFEEPKPPKSVLPKPELAKPAVPKRRELPKLALGGPVENDENVENREIAGVFEKRFELNPKPEACMFDGFSRLAADKEYPELFLPKDPFLEFPNEFHWPVARTLLA